MICRMKRVAARRKYRPLEPLKKAHLPEGERVGCGPASFKYSTTTAIYSKAPDFNLAPLL